MFKFPDFSLNKKRNKTRSRMEIVREMLSAASEKTRKTRLMYQACLNFQQMEKYLMNLLEIGLLKCIDDCYYVITPKGKKFLQIYTDHQHRCSRISDEIKGVYKDWLLLQNMCSQSETTPK